MDNKVIIGGLFGLGIAALSGAAIFKHFSSTKKIDVQEPRIINEVIPSTLTLIGDVGGTNIRLQLIELTNANYEDTNILKQ